MSYVPVAEQRLIEMRRALYDTADKHGMGISVRQLTVLAEAVTSTLYPSKGRPDPALAIHWQPHSRRLGQPLSDVERVCLRYATDGATNAEIGNLIGQSEAAAKAHLGRAYNKLGARNRAHAVALFLVREAEDAADAAVGDDDR